MTMLILHSRKVVQVTILQSDKHSENNSIFQKAVSISICTCISLSFIENIQVFYPHLRSGMWYITELLHKSRGSVFKIFTCTFHLKLYEIQGGKRRRKIIAILSLGFLVAWILAIIFRNTTLPNEEIYSYLPLIVFPHCLFLNVFQPPRSFE
jgi:hypothetical protein